jgi:hypothetical protein
VSGRAEVEVRATAKAGAVAWDAAEDVPSA